MEILEGIVRGEYGKAITITLVDSDGAAVDISSFTTITCENTSPDTNLTSSETCSFTTDGTDGKITYSFDDGDIPLSGDWRSQIYLSKTGVLAKSNVFITRIGKDQSER